MNSTVVNWTCWIDNVYGDVNYILVANPPQCLIRPHLKSSDTTVALMSLDMMMDILTVTS
jgi:hypothetical protein